MSTQTSERPTVDRTSRRQVAAAFLAAAGSWVVYIVCIATLTSADYEQPSPMTRPRPPTPR